MEKDTIMITAAADGIVLHTGFNTTFGNFIILSHETDQNLTLTFYCHLEKILAFRNTNILQGETIAEMGNTGISTSKHLHFMMATLNPSGIRFINPAPHFIT
jgi:murein DD-endopeptidase MepM/ murein hydrolase activator NlpD